MYCIIKCNKKIYKKHSKNDILISLTKLERIILTMLNNNITILKKCHYKHLTPSNRGQIQAYRIEGKSIRFIAKMLGKSPSTISGELKRNSVTQMDSSYAFKDVYIADTAHILYIQKKKTEVYLP